MHKDNSYPVNWVRLACQHIYGAQFNDVTWRTWQRIAQIKPRTIEVGKEKAQWLMAIAFLKREKPQGGRGSKVTVTDAILLLKSNPALVARLNQEMGDAIYSEGLDGRHLPQFIQRATGRKVTVRTLYRWSSRHQVDFHVGQPVPPTSINRLIAIARRAE